MPPLSKNQGSDIQPVDIQQRKVGGAITVAATVHATAAGCEAMQPIVSQWQPLSTPQFAAYDATTTDGLTCAGYYGAVSMVAPSDHIESVTASTDMSCVVIHMVTSMIHPRGKPLTQVARMD